jgi:hypothetical protein
MRSLSVVLLPGWLHIFARLLSFLALLFVLVSVQGFLFGGRHVREY